MIILSFDVESTGLHIENDRVIEVGAILYSTTHKKCLESQGFLVKSDKPISEEITRLTGIKQSAVDKFGRESDEALDIVLKLAASADAWIGQNVIRFDKRMLDNWAKRENKTVPGKLWIDSRTDFTQEGKHLQYMCADRGFLNLFPHSALSDCQSVLKLLEFEDLPRVLERAGSPTIVLLSHQKREDNELAKKQKFRWNPNLKVWWKTIKEIDKQKEIDACSFGVSVAPPEILVETLWYDN